MKEQKAIRFLKQDPHLSEIIKQVGSYQIKQRNHHFASRVEAIISQQLAGAAAYAILQRFKKLYPTFPKPADVLDTKDSELRLVGLSKMKIEYLKDLAKKIEHGEIKIKTLSKMTDEEVISHLTQVKGIGRWTAEMFLIFSLERQDVFPVGDLGLRKGVQKAFSLKELPNPKDV
ncbi:MAG TPA: hypothetical protein VLB45_02700, partial [Nitrosopumilaceae archaeon]|nr:hypothetical protein [Nitrosopumilaceae archaeon]